MYKTGPIKPIRLTPAVFEKSVYLKQKTYRSTNCKFLSKRGSRKKPTCIIWAKTVLDLSQSSSKS